MFSMHHGAPPRSCTHVKPSEPPPLPPALALMQAPPSRTCDELNDDAAHTPHVTGVGPAQTQDDLWRAVVARGHNGRVVLVLKCCAAKVNDLDGAGCGHARTGAAGPACRVHTVWSAWNQPL